MSIIEVRPYRGGWQSFECPGVEPYFTGPDAKSAALAYAKERMAWRSGELRVMRPDGSVEESFFFDRQRKI